MGGGEKMKLDGIHSYTNKKEDIFEYENPALIVIDMQKGFCYPGKSFGNTANLDLVSPIKSLIDYFREKNFR